MLEGIICNVCSFFIRIKVERLKAQSSSNTCSIVIVSVASIKLKPIRVNEIQPTIPSIPIENPIKKDCIKLISTSFFSVKKRSFLRKFSSFLKDKKHKISPPNRVEYFSKSTLPNIPILEPKKHKQKTVVAITLIHFSFAVVLNAKVSPQKNESRLTESDVNNKIKIFISCKKSLIIAYSTKNKCVKALKSELMVKYLVKYLKKAIKNL